MDITPSFIPQPRWLRRTALQSLGALFAFACVGSTDICACPPSIIGGYVMGTVLLADSSPASAARVYQATNAGSCPVVDTTSSGRLTDSLGQYESFVGPLSASTDSLCVTLIALPADTDTTSGASPVTQRWIAVRIYPPGPLDTAYVNLVLAP